MLNVYKILTNEFHVADSWSTDEVSPSEILF